MRVLIWTTKYFMPTMGMSRKTENELQQAVITVRE